MKPLVKLTEDESNPTVDLNKFLEAQPVLYMTTSSAKVYYPYNNEVVDSGWGCAWRAIQTALSPAKNSFEELFSHYSKL